jgi:hypothetical protein
MGLALNPFEQQEERCAVRQYPHCCCVRCHAGFSKVCPAGSSWSDYAALPTGYGVLVSDNWVCDNPYSSRKVRDC